jgi:hypothetical protein
VPQRYVELNGSAGRSLIAVYSIGSCSPLLDGTLIVLIHSGW